MLINRDNYYQKIKNYMGNPVIKVITGMRRSGKSFFLKEIIQELKKKKIPVKNILYIDKEATEFDFIRNYKDLDQYIHENLLLGESKSPRYILIDEIQEIENWEKCIRSIAKQEQAEIFITGSNAYLLSSELATFISGRYIEFPIYPLSFKEFIKFREVKAPVKNLEDEFLIYIKFGGLPGLHNSSLDETISYPYISSILNTVILKDIVARNQIREYASFENILKFVFDNIGSTFSAKSISDYLKSQNIKVTIETIQNYLSFLEAAYVVYKARRYDLQGKRHLEIHEKYYLADLGLRHALLGYKSSDINDYLENIVYIELKRRGYEVSIGKIGNLEIDFIATKATEKIYVQVTYLLASEDVVEREFKPLQKIKDNYPKYVLSMDKFYGEMFEGIKRLNIIDWLLEDVV